MVDSYAETLVLSENSAVLTEQDLHRPVTTPEFESLRPLQFKFRRAPATCSPLHRPHAQLGLLLLPPRSRLRRRSRPSRDEKAITDIERIRKTHCNNAMKTAPMPA